MNQELDRLLGEEVENRTFSAEAIEGIKQMRDALKEAEADNVRLRAEAKETTEKTDAEIAELKAELKTTKAQVAKVDEREHELDKFEGTLEKRQNELFEAEKKAAFESGQGQGAFKLMEGFTRNTSFRSSAYGSKDHPYQDNHGNHMTGRSHHDETHTATAE